MFGLTLLQHPGRFVHSITLLPVGSVCRCLIQSVFEVSEIERNQRVLTMFYPQQMLSVIIAGFISVKGKLRYILVKVIYSFAYVLYIVLREDEACNFSSSYLFTSMVTAFFFKNACVHRYYVKLNFLMFFCVCVFLFSEWNF